MKFREMALFLYPWLADILINQRITKQHPLLEKNVATKFIFPFCNSNYRRSSCYMFLREMIIWVDL